MYYDCWRDKAYDDALDALTPEENKELEKLAEEINNRAGEQK